MLPFSLMVLLLVSALAILLARSIRVAKILSTASLGVSFVLSVAMAALTAGGDVLGMSIGTAPWNVSVAVGALESYMACLFTGIGLLVNWSSLTTIGHDVEDNKIPLYYALITLLIGMLCGVVFFANVINVFVIIEFSSFAAAGIVIIKNQPDNIRAGLKYLTLSILGSGLVLLGIVILYTVTGALDFAGIHAGMQGAIEDNLSSVLYALVFITLGVGLKSALFPFHIWLPDAHAFAPSSSSALLSSLVLKAFIVFYIKVLYSAIGTAALQGRGLQALLHVVMILGVVSMIFGSIMALLQTDLKRMIAYSSVAQIGYIFMGIGLGTRMGLYAALFHITAHAVAKSSLFLVSGNIIERTQNRRLDRMGGIGLRMPITMAMFTIGALSMIGIPFFIGFNSKWNFSMAVMDAGQYWIMAMLALSTLLNALYYLPVVVRAYFGEEARALYAARRAGEAVSIEKPIRELLPIMILAACIMLAAMGSGLFTPLIETAVSSLW